MAFSAARGVNLTAEFECRDTGLLPRTHTRAQCLRGRKGRVRAGFTASEGKNEETTNAERLRDPAFHHLETETKDQTRLKIDFRSNIG
jgi:hypothetical protein